MALPTSRKRNRRTAGDKPLRVVIVVERSVAHLPMEEINHFWQFGPRTKHRWPGGDFRYRGIDGQMHVGESAWPMGTLLNKDGMVLYDPDLHVDAGL